MKHIHCCENNVIRFREITEEDLSMVRTWRNEPQINKWFVHSEHISEESQRLWYDRYCLMENDYYFIVEDKVHGYGAIGTMGFYFLGDGGVEFGRLMVGNVNAKGKGLSHQIMTLYHELVFGILQVDYSYLEVYCHNVAAVRTYVKAGYEIMEKMYNNKVPMYIMKKLNA